MNLLLTNRCVRACPYCFAQRELGDRSELLSFENLIHVADLLRVSGQPHVSLLGGEPTLHPQFVDFVLYLLARELRVTVFTSGVLSPARLAEVAQHLGELPHEQLCFVCNLNDPGQTPAVEGEAERVHAFLATMGPYVTPGFNIYRPDFDLRFLCDLVNRYGLRRELRLGLAHPIPGQENQFIRPDQMRAVMDRLMAQRPLLERMRLTGGLDCGFPLCQLTDEELGWLGRHGGNVNFSCGPVLDVRPDMTVYSCFPLSTSFRRSLFEFDHVDQVYQHFLQMHRALRDELPGIYEECDGCHHRSTGRCSGGGACQLVWRLQGEAPIRLPRIEHELKARLSR